MTTTPITGATAWDGISDHAVPQQVLVVDGRIGRLADAIEPPPDARAIDPSGHTPTPGVDRLPCPRDIDTAGRCGHGRRLS
jgi:hypothetical protein